MGEWGKGVGAEVLFSRRWECLTLVHLTPPFKKSRGEGQVLKKEGVRCTTIEGVACQEWLAKGVRSFQECLTKSVAPRVSL